MTLVSQMGPLAHATQQGCLPKTPEQSDPEHTGQLLVPSRTTSTSESGAHNIVAVYPTAPLELGKGALPYPIAKQPHLPVRTQPGDREHDNINLWNDMNYHQHVYDINITKPEPYMYVILQ